MVDSGVGKWLGRPWDQERTLANGSEPKRELSMAGSSKGYKIRAYTNGKAPDGSRYKNYALTVPNDIAEAIPNGITFIPRMTDDGLLYEPVDQAKQDLPPWAKNGQVGTNHKARREKVV